MRSKSLRAAIAAAAVALASAASGCVSSSQKKTDSGERVVCDDWKPTGSHISRMTCQRQADKDARRKRDTEGLRRNQLRGHAPAEAGSP